MGKSDRPKLLGLDLQQQATKISLHFWLSCFELWDILPLGLIIYLLAIDSFLSAVQSTEDRHPWCGVWFPSSAEALSIAHVITAHVTTWDIPELAAPTWWRVFGIQQLVYSPPSYIVTPIRDIIHKNPCLIFFFNHHRYNITPILPQSWIGFFICCFLLYWYNESGKNFEYRSAQYRPKQTNPKRYFPRVNAHVHFRV